MMRSPGLSLLQTSAKAGTGKTRCNIQYFSTVAPSSGVKKTTILDIQKKYKDNIPLSMVTAYDYTSAISVDKSGIDMILVGDSAGMVMMGYDNTTQVTMEDMIHHCKSVKRGAKRAFLVGDMPFGSYEISPVDAGEEVFDSPIHSSIVRNATRLLKEGQMEAVKMEGGKRIKEQVKAVVAAGIPVIGHIGLTPQTLSALGGFKVQGKNAAQAQLLLEDALALQECGVSAIVIESVPAPVAEYVTKKLLVPTIGIGAGNGTSGQVLVYHDMLGLYPNFVPKFSKQYISLSPTIVKALEEFKREVESREFPTVQHSYSISQEELHKAFPDVSEYVVMPQKEKVEKAEKVETVDKVSEVKAPTLTTSTTIKEKKKNIAVIGGGSMGSLVGGKLAATGDSNIWMVSSWKEHVDKINKEGLTVRNLDNTTQKIFMNATTTVDEILSKVGNVDLALIMVKGPHTKQAAEKAAKLVDKKGFVLTLQNGIGNIETISEALGDRSRVIQGVTSHGGNILQSGVVAHTGYGTTAIALDPNNHLIVKEIASMLNKAGIECEVNEELESLLWGKLIVNSAINPLSAILRVKNGVLAESPACREIIAKTVKEGVTVAGAKGVPLPFKDPFESVLNVARSTKDNTSSMLRDVLRGTKTEIDSINGAIVREGERHGVDVLLNRMMIGLMELPSVSGDRALHILQSC